MKKGSLEKKLKEYYNKLHNSKYIIGDWTIIDEALYKKIYNKLKITSINNIFQEAYKAISLANLGTPDNKITENSIETIIVAESKKETIVIKYNINFIAFRIAETEYSVFTGEYDLLAVNKNYIYNKVDTKLISPKELFSKFKIKLSRKAMKDLDYFD